MENIKQKQYKDKKMKKIYLVLTIVAATLLFSGCSQKSVSPHMDKSPCACVKVQQFEA